MQVIKGPGFKNKKILKASKRIKNSINDSNISFTPIDNTVIQRELRNLDQKKSMLQNNIPFKIMKSNTD